MTNKKWTDEQLIEAIKTSTNKTEVINKMKPNAPCHRTMDKYINKLNIDISHFDANLEAKNRSKKNKEELELIISKILKTKRATNSEVFIENSIFDYKTAKTRILREKLLPYKCNL